MRTIVEGRVKHMPIMETAYEGDKQCYFTVVNNRYYFQDKTMIHETTEFHVKTRGYLAVKCFANLDKGSLVLVNGIMDDPPSGVLLAENVKHLTVRRTV